MKPINSISPLEIIETTRVLSIIRMDDLAAVLKIADAIYRGGIRCFEIPMTAANADDIIRELRHRLPNDTVIGAGTVLSEDAASQIIDAGASFVVTPHFVPEVGPVCKRRDVVFIPGAMTPFEIYRAWTEGADIVKVFSIRALGPDYLTDLAGPYPDIKLMPTGGVNLRNAASFIKAGACAVTIGRDLIGKGPWSNAELAEITNRTRSLVDTLGEAGG